MARRVLVIGPAWVGDMVMSQVIYAHLRTKEPDIVLDVLCASGDVKSCTEDA